MDNDRAERLIHELKMLVKTTQSINYLLLVLVAIVAGLVIATYF